MQLAQHNMCVEESVDYRLGNLYFYLHHDGIRTDIPSDRIMQAVAASHMAQFQLYTAAWQGCVERLRAATQALPC